ncbi:MAG: hypothetical protein H6Q08_2528, partial [Acidobacteria bacterium]|nr:hypothetical protein [Acidobacteriota bacterium]
MRARTCAFGLAVGVSCLLVADPLVEACGDKLLSIARGIRLQQAYKTRYPASILLYAGRASGLEKSGKRDPLLQMTLLYMSLKQAGHKPQAVDTVIDLDELLTIGHFDLVLAEIEDVGSVNEHVAKLQSSATLLPIVYKPSKAELAAARERFPLVLKMPATSTQHLEAIDQAMKSRPQGATQP